MISSEQMIELVEWFIDRYETEAGQCCGDDLPYPEWGVLLEMLKTGKKLERYYDQYSQEGWKTREVE